MININKIHRFKNERSKILIFMKIFSAWRVEYVYSAGLLHSIYFSLKCLSSYFFNEILSENFWTFSSHSLFEHRGTKWTKNCVPRGVRRIISFWKKSFIFFRATLYLWHKRHSVSYTFWTLLVRHLLRQFLGTLKIFPKSSAGPF